MAYDEVLADRLREILSDEPGLREQRMFGGLAFLLHGNMAVACSGQGGLMVRIAPADHDELVAHAHARPFEMHGRTMGGWLEVDREALGSDDDLRGWVRHGVEYARTLPPKK